MTKRSHVFAAALVVAIALAQASGARADEAAPLPAKDIRWSATLGGAVDSGGLPRASTGLAFGFDVRRGALAARGVTSVFVPQTDRVTGASVSLVDLMASICALAPVGSRIDFGACGGAGGGLLRGATTSDAGVSLRPEGLAVMRLDVSLTPALFLSLDAGTVLDPLRTPFPLARDDGDEGRASLFSFRGTLALHLRVW